MTASSTESKWSGESGRCADPDRVIDVIERKLARLNVETISDDPEQRQFWSWHNPRSRKEVRDLFGDFRQQESLLPGFGPAGYGNNAREDCGDAYPFLCGSCGQTVEFGRTCSQSVCMRCGVAWVRDSAIKKTAKLRRLRIEKNQHTADQEHQKFHHGVISPPLAWYRDLSKAGYSLEEANDITKEIVKEILNELHAQGVIVRHSYRGADADGSIVSEHDDIGLWKELLNSERMFYSDVRDQLTWKPHYHCIVVTDWFKTADFTKWIEAATGWVIHRIEDEDGNSLYSDGDMARALTYSLSHGDIDVYANSNNSSAANYVGAALGSIFKSSPRFVSTDSDLSWADGKVREHCWRLLGLNSASTDCGASIPPVDDPSEFARKVLLELYPNDEPPAHVNTEGVLHHVAKGNIRVDVSTTSGGGGNITVCDAFGQKLGGSDGLDSGFPAATGGGTQVVYSGKDSPIRVVDEDGADQGDSCGDGCGHDHSDDTDKGHVCDGTLIPLTEARTLGLLEDKEWCADAPFVEQARKADREWPDDLERWKSTPVVNAVGVS